RLEGVLAVAVGQGRVGRGLDSEDAALVGTGLDDVVRLHPLGPPEGARPRVRDEDWLVARLDGVERGPVARVGDVDGDAELVHPAHGLAAEGGEAAVPRLPEAGPERVRLAVG